MFLDTELYGAHMTMADALWAGLPAVTVGRQSRMAGRIGSALLLAARLGQGSVSDMKQYEDMVAQLITGYA